MLDLLNRLAFWKGDGVREIAPDDDPEAERLRKELQDHRWDSVTAFYGGLSLPDKEFYTHALATWKGRPAFFDRWVSDQPQSPLAHLMRGYHSVRWGWEARSGARADELSQEQIRLFGERLQAACVDLKRSLELAADANSYWGLLSAGVGLNANRATADSLFHAGMALDPEHVGLHRRMLWYLCQKWHGNHGEMFAFARRVSEAAREGSPTHFVIPHAHAERWLYAAQFDRDISAGDYWQRSDVRSEIVTAYDRSLGSPDHRESKLSREVSNDFAFCFGFLQDRERLAECIRRIDDRPTSHPWVFKSANPARHYRKLKRLAGIA